MSDMRATERLLEFIAERSDDPGTLQAVMELRRRGDTLVRREDLRAALRHIDPLDDDPAIAPALERLDRALGGG